MPTKGRPPTYHPERHPQLAENLALLGATEQELANAAHVHIATIQTWKRLYPAFREAIARGKVEADAHVARALYHRARGYEHEAVKIFLRKDDPEPVYAKYMEHVPPDTQAASLWLRNRRGPRPRAEDDPLQWTERVEHTGADGGPISLEALLLAADQSLPKVIEHATPALEAPADDNEGK
jgi:hypothetical protein